MMITEYLLRQNTFFCNGISKPKPKPKQNQNNTKINTKTIKTISKPIPKPSKLYQNQYFETKTTSKPRLQYQNFKTSFGFGTYIILLGWVQCLMSMFFRVCFFFLYDIRGKSDCWSILSYVN
jgi:hypothetical protein